MVGVEEEVKMIHIACKREENVWILFLKQDFNKMKHHWVQAESCYLQGLAGA